MQTNGEKERHVVGWDERSIRELIEYCESQSDEDAAAEHEAALSHPTGTLMDIPTELVPLVRDLIARHQQKRGHRRLRRQSS